MSIICFASLKGGVGKTSLAINVAHAFAKRGCRTLLIDLDPAAHTSRFFDPSNSHSEAVLARLFMSPDAKRDDSEADEKDQLMFDANLPLFLPVRDNFDVLKGGPELRHFYWGRGARLFRNLFPALLEELHESYDFVVIDTAPDFNVITRNAIAASNLVAVPVDSSEMSIYCLEELLASCRHIRQPSWCIIRSMVAKRASRVQRLASSRLAQAAPRSIADIEEQETRGFISMLHEREQKTPSDDKSEDENSPIYLLKSFTYRSEQQNRLTFIRKTAFDLRETRELASCYYKVARELEELLSILDGNEGELLPMGFSADPDIGGCSASN